MLRSHTRVIALLAELRFVPVVACLGLGVDGRMFNVNADTFAGAVAGALKAKPTASYPR